MSNIYWDGVINRICEEARYRLKNNGSSKSVAIISLNVLIGVDGNPIVWTVEGKRVEPTSKARDILMGLSGSQENILT
jgi:hypothetical protein